MPFLRPRLPSLGDLLGNNELNMSIGKHSFQAFYSKLYLDIGSFLIAFARELLRASFLLKSILNDSIRDRVRTKQKFIYNFLCFIKHLINNLKIHTYTKKYISKYIHFLQKYIDL